MIRLQSRNLATAAGRSDLACTDLIHFTQERANDASIDTWHETYVLSEKYPG